MPPKLRPQKFIVNANCAPQCSLNEARCPISSRVHEAYEAGLNNHAISVLSDTLGHHLSEGAIGRHRGRHLSPLNEAGAPSDEVEFDASALDNIDVLRAIILRGAKSMHSWKVGPETTLKAMELLYKLTAGNAMDSVFAALASAASGVDDDPARPGDGSDMSEDEAAQAEVA